MNISISVYMVGMEFGFEDIEFIEKLARKLHLQNVQGIAQFKVKMNCHRICKNIFVVLRMYVLFGCFVVS